MPETALKTKQETQPKTSMLDKIKSLGVGGLVLLIIGFGVQYFFPWWSLAIVGLLGGAFFARTWGGGFILGFAAFSVLWAGYAVFLSSANNQLMVGSITNLLGNVVSAGALSYVSGFIGGLVGGLSTATGVTLRNLFR